MRGVSMRVLMLRMAARQLVVDRSETVAPRV